MGESMYVPANGEQLAHIQSRFPKMRLAGREQNEAKQVFAISWLTGYCG
jgi:hypothetical protein